MESIIRKLVEIKIDPILIGGRAAIIHGLTNQTADWDFVIPKSDYAREAVRLSLAGQSAFFRCVDASTKVPMKPNALDGRQNLRFTTKSGDIDFIHALDFKSIPEITYDIKPVVDHDELLGHCDIVFVFGVNIHVLKPEPLVMSKMSRGHAVDSEVCQRFLENPNDDRTN